jgi:hypothetical protein
VRQHLYDFGISFPAIDVIQGASYFVLAFSIVSVRLLLERSRWRWLLSLLLAIAFVQPILQMLAYIAWSINGFAP